MVMWECSVTRTSVKLYDIGERNGGRPAGEETKTRCSTLAKFKGTKREFKADTAPKQILAEVVTLVANASHGDTRSSV